MKLINKIFIILITFFLINACSGLKENLSLKKKQGVDEFLIKKKNPLTVPPDFSSLPKPRTTIEEEEDTSIDLKKVLSNSNEKKEISSSNNLEKSISDILNKK
mgnify:CR=1 FL=1